MDAACDQCEDQKSMDDLTTAPDPRQPEAPAPPGGAGDGARQGDFDAGFGGDVVGADGPTSPHALFTAAATDAGATSARFHAWSEAPTLVSASPIALDEAHNAQTAPLARGSASGSARDAARNQRSRRTRRLGGRRRGLIALISLALLLVLATPVALAAVSAAHDYTTLKGLGESGLAHLLAVKSDLTGKTTSSGSGSSSASALPSLSSLTSGSGTTATLLAAVQALLTPPGPNVTDPAYTYLAQRQSGTFYPLSVTVQPAKGVAADGGKTVNFKATVNSNTYFAVGGQPIATPTPIAATPAATPAKATPTTSVGSATPGATSGHASSLVPDPARIAAATSDLRAAESDFQSLGAQLAHPDTTLALAAMLPAAANDLHAAQTLAVVGVDISQAGLALLGAATPLLTRLHGTSSLLSGSQKLITSADISALQSAMSLAVTRLTDASARLKAVDVNALPLSAHQKALFTEVEPLLPQINALLPQASGMIGLAGWLLGVDAQRNFLIQTLDRGEMRASGGFTGQYGVVSINDGKLGPISLQDVNCLDYLTGCLSNGWIFGRRPPAPYDLWWPFANWGLRDSNLSADFPTNARLVMDVYYHETGQHVDGLIDVSPIAIEDVLRITGPIQVPLYGEIVTADNLEAKLHYYQQDPAAIAKENQLSAGDNSTSTRKRFTQLVGQLLQEKVKSLPVSEVAQVAERMLLDMRSKDLEVYFTNPKVEALLTQLHVDGSVNTTPGADGFLLAQSNVSVSKATSFVKVTQHDTVSLDSKGGATHHLTLTFSANYTYNQVYGYLTYRDYLRIYVPPQSRLLGGDGFDSGQPLCWAPYQDPKQKEPAVFKGVPPCSADPYPQGELYCPSGNYAPGPQSTTVATAANPIPSDGYTPWALDQLGGPTNTTSDLANRAMYAGFVVVPDYCTATVTLSWYTPNVAAK